MKVNTDLLNKLYTINHRSGQEFQMLGFIINWINKNVKNVEFDIDHYCNLFITKNTTNPSSYSCLVAHMDEAQDNKRLKNPYLKNGIIYGKKCGLGADDSNGIYIILEMLKVHPNLKVCFTTEEELGGLGAEEAVYNTEFFNDVNYLLQADRRGNSDLITETNGIKCCSDEFLKDLIPICEKFSYSPNIGTFTDIGVLSEHLNISGVNISCGYYNEHTTKEYTIISELENCLNFINKILSTLQHKKYYISNEEMNSYYVPTTYSYQNEPDSCKNCTLRMCDECDEYWEWWYKKEKEEEQEKNHLIINRYPKGNYTENMCKYCQDFDCRNCKYD